MVQTMRSMVTATRELAAMFAAIGLVPLGPPLAATYVDMPWQAAVLAGAWSAAWYVWVWLKLK